MCVSQSLFNVGSASLFVVCMVAQLHALRTQQNKHLLSVEFSYREHWLSELSLPQSQKWDKFAETEPPHGFHHHMYDKGARVHW